MGGIQVRFSRRIIAAICGLSCLALTNLANAAIIFDTSPGNTGQTALTNLSNISNSQNFATRFTIGTDVNLTGMDSYSTANFAAPGQPVRVRIWEDNAGSIGTINTQINSTIDTTDVVGCGTQVDCERRFALFDLSLSAGSYWVGMSGVSFQLAVYSASLSGIDTALLNDLTVATPNFTIDPFLRLHGNATLQPVPIPAALPLFLGALAGLGGLGFMKRRKAA